MSKCDCGMAVVVVVVVDLAEAWW